MNHNTPDYNMTSSDQIATSTKGTILPRRLVIGGILGLGSIAMGIGGYQYTYQPRVIQESTEKKEQEFTLKQESYVQIGREEAYSFKDYLVYSNSNPETIHLMNDLNSSHNSKMDMWDRNTKPVEETILPPGKYYISSLYTTPAVRSSSISFLRENNEPVTTISNYLIAMRRELLTSWEETRSAEEVKTVGLNPGVLIPSPGTSILQKDDFRNLFERTRANELRVKPLVSRVGGEIQEQYRSFVRQNMRARAALHIWRLANKNFNLDGGLGRFSGVLTTTPQIPKEVTDSLNAANINFYCLPAKLDGQSSGYVPIGIQAAVNPDEVDWVDTYTVYFSQTVPIPVKNNSKNPPRWETPISDIKAGLIQKLSEIV
jgi:hypothetical protein